MHILSYKLTTLIRVKLEKLVKKEDIMNGYDGTEESVKNFYLKLASVLFNVNKNYLCLVQFLK